MRTRKWIQSILLLSLGLYFLDNMLSGRIFFYINERFGWLSWLATGIFLVLGILGVADLLRARREDPAHDQHDHADHDHEGHDHDHDTDEHHHTHDEHVHAHDGHNHGAAPSWPILALVGLPLILGLLVPAKPLGASAVGTSGVSTNFSGLQASSATQLTIAPNERNVLDWVRAFNSSSNVDEFAGQEADLIGFVYRDVRFKDATQFMVARFTISCCVADASAIGVVVQSADAAKMAQDSWVHVKGKYQVQKFDDQRTPILVADSIEATNQPEHPYLYP